MTIIFYLSFCWLRQLSIRVLYQYKGIIYRKLLIFLQNDFNLTVLGQLPYVYNKVTNEKKIGVVMTDIFSIK